MKLTEIKENLIKDLDDYTGDFTLYLYHHDEMIWTKRATKPRIDLLALTETLFIDLGRFLGSRAYKHLEDGSSTEGYGYRIEGTITYEIRHDYIRAKDSDDA